MTQVTTLVDPRRGDRQGARDARRGGTSWSSAPRCAPCRRRRPRALENAAAGRPTWPAATSTRAASCSSAAARLVPGGPRGRAQAQGGQLRPRRGLRGRRAEARARSRCSTPSARSSRWRPARRSTTSSISNVMEGRARDARVIAVATEGDPPDRALSPTTSAGCPTPTRRSARSWRSSRSSCSPTTWRSPAARTSTSRATWRSRSRSSRRDGRGRCRRRRSRCRSGLVPPGTTELGIDIIKVDRIRAALERFGARFSRPRPDRRPSGATSATGPRRSPAAGRPRRRSARSSGSASAASAGATSRSSGCRPASRRSASTAARPRRAEQLGMGRIALSITHESDYAVAIAFGIRTRRRAVRLPARHRGPARRARAADPGPARAAPRRCHEDAAAAPTEPSRG